MKIISLLGAIIVISVTTGCASNSVARVSCVTPTEKTVDGYAAAAARELSTSACQSRFDTYFSELVDIATENPGDANKGQFATLIRAGMDAGAISSSRGKRLFNQYFEPEFYALKGEHRSNCVALREKDVYAHEMESELQLKKVGLLDVMADEDSFRLAQQYYQDLTTVIDAVNHSCEASLARR